MNVREGVIAGLDQDFDERPDAPCIRDLHRSVESAVRNNPRTGPYVRLDNVLIATDFSKHAGHAVDRAAALADQGVISTTVLLHVVPQSPVASIQRLLRRSSRAKEKAEVGSARRLEAVAAEIRRRTVLTVYERAEEGGVVKAIQRCAPHVDLVLLGAPGARPLRDLALGSTAGRVLRATRKPVLVIRRPADAPYRRVVVAVDFATDAGNALAYAQALAPEAKLNLVHVYRGPHEGKMLYAGVAEGAIREYRARTQAEAAGQMIELALSHLPSADVRMLLTHGYAAPKLLAKERELGADLVVVTKGKDSLARDLLFESVTQQLVEKSHCDVLVVREATLNSRRV